MPTEFNNKLDFNLNSVLLSTVIALSGWILYTLVVHTRDEAVIEQRVNQHDKDIATLQAITAAAQVDILTIKVTFAKELKTYEAAASK